MKEFIKSKWGKAAILIIALQFIASIVFEVTVLLLDLLPTKYILVVSLLLLFLLLVDFKLVFTWPKKDEVTEEEGKKSAKGGLYAQRIIGTVIASVVVIGTVIGSIAVGLLGETLGDLFDDVKVETEVTSTYVLKEDKAEDLADAADYTFGIVREGAAAAMKWENTQTAIRDINKYITDKKGEDTEIRTREYGSITDMVDALRSKEVEAILLNEGYVSVLEEDKKYEDFSETTKILHSSERTVKKKVEKKEDVTEKPFIVYLSGSDTRKSTLKAEKARSDVNLIAVVHPKTKQILLISTPRDSYVYTTVSGTMRDKLTHCGIYGIDCSIGTLENLYGIDVTHYAQINFTGFEKLIDAIDGIDCYSEKETYTREGHFHLIKGMNHMSGEVALAFVRDRFTYPDGDFARSRHQMAVIAAVAKKASSGSTIIQNYGSILGSLKGMFVSDFQDNEFSALAKMQLDDMASWNIQSYTIQGEGAKALTYSMPTQRSYVMFMDENSVAHAKTLIQKVLNGSQLTEDEVKDTESESGSGQDDGSDGTGTDTDTDGDNDGEGSGTGSPITSTAQ